MAGSKRRAILAKEPVFVFQSLAIMEVHRAVNSCIQVASADYRCALVGDRLKGLKFIASSSNSDLRIEIEKGVQASLELDLDLFPRPLNHVHGHMRQVPVCQLEGCILDFSHFAFREKPESVD